MPLTAAEARKVGRLAGIAYLVVVATGMFCLMYVPARLAAYGGPVAAIAAIGAGQSLFKAGIAAFLLMQVAFLLLLFPLHKLLAPAGRTAAAMMVVLAAVSVPIALAGLVGRMDALSLMTDPTLAQRLPKEQSFALAQLSIEHYRNGIHAASLFWGLWLLPFGYLVVRSGCLPKFLGWMLMLGCGGYVVSVFGDLLIPGYAQSIVATLAAVPHSIGELGACLWLLVFGARAPVVRQD